MRCIIVHALRYTLRLLSLAAAVRFSNRALKKKKKERLLPRFDETFELTLSNTDASDIDIEFHWCYFYALREGTQRELKHKHSIIRYTYLYLEYGILCISYWCKYIVQLHTVWYWCCCISYNWEEKIQYTIPIDMHIAQQRIIILCIIKLLFIKAIWFCREFWIPLDF